MRIWFDAYEPAEVGDPRLQEENNEDALMDPVALGEYALSNI